MKDIFSDLYDRVLSFFTTTQPSDDTKVTAKNRLRTVLMQDRVGFSERAMQMLKDDLLESISRYLEIEEDSFDLSIDATESATILNLSIPVLRTKTDEEIDEALNAQEKQKIEIEAFLDKASRLGQKGLVKDEIELWKTAVAKYPNNYQCLTQYAYALFSAKHSDAFDNDEQTADKYTAQALEICERILEDCKENEWRDCATQILVMIYGTKSRGYFNEEKAVSYAEQATDLYCCREILLESAYRVNSEKYLSQKHSNSLHYLDLLTMNIFLVKYKDSSEKIFALKTALTIWNAVFYDGNFLFYHCRIAQIYRYLAIEYAKCKDEVNVIESLRLAKKHAQAKEKLPDGKHYYTSIFLNKTYHDNSTSSKNFSCSEIDLISNILADKVFDFIRESKEFLEFKNTPNIFPL